MFVCVGSYSDTGTSDFGIRFSGFVKTDFMFDSRQTIAAREGHFLLYPAIESLDLNGDDINARPNLNILAIQTRLKGSITGPDAFGAETSGLIEGAFFGHSNSDVNGFRLRHAFLKLKWQKTSLLLGQYWHPMFVTDVFPGTVSFNTGAPFQPFSRNPQIRLTRAMGKWNWILAGMSQRDFVSTGPDGASSVYLRNSAIPNLHAQLQLKTESIVCGFGGDWKRLLPKLSFKSVYVDGVVDSVDIKATESVSSLSALAYAKLTLHKMTWKVEGVLGQNMTDHLMLGGYAVATLEEPMLEDSYLPTRVLSIWSDLSFGKKIAGGLFAGYTKNMGAEDHLNMGENYAKYYGRGPDIGMIYRIAPRVMWNSGKTRFAAELEYTAAGYGTPRAQGKVEDTEIVGNMRLVLAAYYFF